MLLLDKEGTAHMSSYLHSLIWKSFRISAEQNKLMVNIVPPSIVRMGYKITRVSWIMWLGKTKTIGEYQKDPDLQRQVMVQRLSFLMPYLRKDVLLLEKRIFAPN